ncbi:MAG: bestrophin family ion channel [Vampirovibrionales bacterium]|nr:bestrophin family ion channel [Vampirovibrionales bacterium]
MIIKPRFKESILSLLVYLKLDIIFSLLYATLIYYLYEQHNLTFLASFSFMPVSFFGAILSVFLAFRNNSAYARWWEARQLWGDLINASRMFAMQTMTYPLGQQQPAQTLHETQSQMIRRHIAIVHLMRMQLRQDVRLERVKQYLNTDDQITAQNAINPAVMLLLSQGRHLQQLYDEGLLSDFRFISLNDTLTRFHNILGACERIKNTPFPREYDRFVRYLIWILTSIIPIYFLGIFSDDLSKMLIIPISVALQLIIGFANKAGALMEDPFENRVHDIPMTSMCNTIERDLIQQLGAHDIPEKTLPKHGVLW